jgi:hypothetical protein
MTEQSDVVSNFYKNLLKGPPYKQN